MSGSPEKGRKRSVSQIEAELQAARDSLTQTAGSISNYVRPANMAARGLGKATQFFVNEAGEVRPERVLAAAAAAIGLLGFLTRDRD